MVNFVYRLDNNKIKAVYTEEYSEWIKLEDLLRCCIRFNATDIIVNLKLLGIDLQQNALA
jgi:hypothetical protein